MVAKKKSTKAKTNRSRGKKGGQATRNKGWMGNLKNKMETIVEDITE